MSLFLGLHYNVVSHWIEVYKAKGFDGLLSNNYGTDTSELASHGQSIFSSFASQPPMSATEAAKEGKIHLLFCDAAHFVLQPFLCFLWTVIRVRLD
ncbi:hypothetical protein [Niabella beijingensis]|uniref:hypothetical protein n=1 Tax=Niabella beijingensis TaxID=2872700 RepID=UPI001CBE97D6|nr:hypothetical protein [Niabella beijingensis]MBZ4192420.1 hypothetical protein [Niabella beijingensis]